MSVISKRSGQRDFVHLRLQQIRNIRAHIESFLLRKTECIGIAMDALFRYKLLYFVQFSGYGVISPYMPIFFESLSMSKSQIGILTMIPNVCCFMVGPVFGFIGKLCILHTLSVWLLITLIPCAAGDKFKAHGEVLIFTLLCSTVASISMFYMHSFNTQLPMVLLTSIFRAPIGPEIDSVVMASLEDKTTYGSMRLWGAVSFGIFSFIGGVMTSSTGRSSGDSPFLYLFYTAAVCSILSGFIILSLLLEEAHKERNRAQRKLDKASLSRAHSNDTLSTADESTYSALQGAEDKITVQNKVHIDSAYKSIDCIEHSPMQETQATQDSSMHNLRDKERSNSVDSDVSDGESRRNILATLAQVLRSNPAVLMFAVVVFLSGFGAGAIDSYLFLHLKELGGSGLVMGIARFITCAAEVPMFQVAGGLQKKYGTWMMISITQFAFVVRFVYYSMLTNPWAVLPCEALNGLTFAVTWSVSCTYANEISPPGCQAVMQALLEGLHFGIGCGVGSLVGGFMYEYFGAVRLFQFCGLLSLCSTVLAVLAWRVCSTPATPEHEHDVDAPAAIKKATIETYKGESKSAGKSARGYLELQQMEDVHLEP